MSLLGFYEFFCLSRTPFGLFWIITYHAKVGLVEHGHIHTYSERKTDKIKNSQQTKNTSSKGSCQGRVRVGSGDSINFFRCYSLSLTVM